MKYISGLISGIFAGIIIGVIIIVNNVGGINITL